MSQQTSVKLGSMFSISQPLEIFLILILYILIVMNLISMYFVAGKIMVLFQLVQKCRNLCPILYMSEFCMMPKNSCGISKSYLEWCDVVPMQHIYKTLKWRRIISCQIPMYTAGNNF